MLIEEFKDVTVLVCGLAEMEELSASADPLDLVKVRVWLPATC